jgi:predicted O-methyltransferase YrrM
VARIGSKCDQYINDLFGAEDDLLSSITKHQSDIELSMQISAYEGKILYLLLKMINACSVVEIGMFAGYSTAWIAKALGQGGKLYTFERDENAITIFKQRIKGSDIEHKIEFYSGNANQTLENFDILVDAVFIDADKASYLNYLEHAKRILKPGGLLIADNVFLFGNVYGETRKKASENTISTMQQFNRSIAEDSQFEAVIIPTLEGLLVARKLSYL